MMRHTLLMVGRLSRPFFRDAAEEYLRRLEGYSRPKLVSVSEADGRDPGRARELEGESLLATADRLGTGYWVALDEGGKMSTSKGLAAFLKNRGVGGDSQIVWFIGGAYGLSDEVKRRCALVLSLSRMTFPHEMVPVIILEQIYRAHRIIRGEPYHH